MGDSWDVAIVGAGFAGVTAARELRRSGRSVLLLEARDRAGGRTWTGSRWGHDLEIGGTWVHWHQPHVWAELTRYCIGIVETALPARVSWLLEDGRRTGTPDQYRTQLGAAMAAALADARDVFPRPYDPLFRHDVVAHLDTYSIAQRLRMLDELTDEQRALGRMMWTLHFNAPCSEGALTQALRWASLAGGDWRLMQEICTHYQIDGGTGRLLSAILNDANTPPTFSTRVTGIEQDDGEVLLRGTDGSQFVTRTAIVTAPLGALGRIDFQPALPEATRSLVQQGQVSRGLKLFARLQGTTEPYVAVSTVTQPLMSVRYLYPDGDHHIVVAFGPDHRALDTADLSAVEKAMRQLVPEAVVASCTGHDWVGDKLTGQTWAMLRPGQLRFLPELQRPFGRVILAGSDYASGWAGLIDGAIESGLRSARVIDDLLSGHRAVGRPTAPA